MKKIGQGTFTKAYLNEDENKVYLVSEDCIKECMSAGWFPDGDLFPSIERSNVEPYDYMMEYFPRTRGLKSHLEPSEYEKYKALRNLKPFFDSNKYNAYFHWFGQFETIQDEALRETMLEALDACSNYGSDIGFEISPRNVAVKDKKLVLLDCFFVIGQLQQVKRK